MIGQAILGALVVKYHLAPGLVMSHFILSMMLLDAAFALAWCSRYEPWERRRSSDRLGVWSVRALIPLGQLTILAGTIATASGPHAGAHEGQLVHRFTSRASRRWNGSSSATPCSPRSTASPRSASGSSCAAQEATGGPSRPLTVVLGLLALQGAVGASSGRWSCPAEIVWVHVALATCNWLAMLWTVAAAGRLEPRDGPAPARATRGERASRPAAERRLGPAGKPPPDASLLRSRSASSASSRRRWSPAPRPASPRSCAGLRSSWWALVLPLSIVVVVGGDRARLGHRPLPHLPGPGRGAAAGGAGPGAGRPRRPPGRWPCSAIPLFALAWAAQGSLGGETAALALSALACVSLGWLLACVVPGRWLKLGIYAMAAIDAWLVGSNLLQEPNAVLNAAAPGGLPRLQFVSFGSAVMGFGDLFIAATLGALLAPDRRLQLTGAALAAAIGLGFDLLFFAVDELPATVPIALTLAVLELQRQSASSELGDDQPRQSGVAPNHGDDASRSRTGPSDAACRSRPVVDAGESRPSISLKPSSIRRDNVIDVDR